MADPIELQATPQADVIVKDGAFCVDEWKSCDATIVLSKEELELYGFGLLERGLEIGLVIPADADLAPLERWLEQLSLIAVETKSFADGRFFTTGKKLRRDLGFSGVLRAKGPIIADQYAYAVECGFDEIQIPASLAERQPARLWTDALAEIGYAYQRGAPGRYAVLAARHDAA